MNECDSSSFHLCLAAALIKFSGAAPRACTAIPPVTSVCVCVCARSPVYACVCVCLTRPYVLIRLNKRVKPKYGEQIRIKVLSLN